jgi:hypothetical protein
MPIALRWRSGYFSLAFSACSLVVNGFDSGVNSRPTYLKSSHRSTILGMGVYSTGFPGVRNVARLSECQSHLARISLEKFGDWREIRRLERL